MLAVILGYEQLHANVFFANVSVHDISESIAFKPGTLVGASVEVAAVVEAGELKLEVEVVVELRIGVVGIVVEVAKVVAVVEVIVVDEVVADEVEVVEVWTSENIKLNTNG